MEEYDDMKKKSLIEEYAETWTALKKYDTKDSGERVDFASGMRRDTDKGKPRYDLIDGEFLRRWAELMARGAEKYGENNWRLANTPEELKRFRASAFRHFMQWIDGDFDEDHAVAVAFNLAAAEYVKGQILLNEKKDTR